MTRGLNEQVEEFRNRPLTAASYPVLWVDAIYEKARYAGRVVSMAILLVCGVNNEGNREVLAIEPMLEESQESYKQLFEKLKKRGLSNHFRCSQRSCSSYRFMLSRCQLVTLQSTLYAKHTYSCIA